MLLGGVVTSFVMYGAPLIAWDWIFIFVWGPNPGQYPPFIVLITDLTAKNLPIPTSRAILHGFTIAVPAIYTFHLARKTHPKRIAYALAAILFVLLNPIPYIIMWAGQINVLSLIGILTMPAGVCLVYAKPHIAPFAMLHSRRDILWFAFFTLITMIVWWGWPYDLLVYTLTYRGGHPLAMGWWVTRATIGWPVFVVGLVLFALTDRNPWRLLASGSMITPFLMPYHYYYILPALGQTAGWRQIAIWFTSCFILAALGVNVPATKLLMYVCPVVTWAVLAPTLKPKEILADPDILLNRGLRFLREILTVRSLDDLRVLLLRESSQV